MDCREVYYDRCGVYAISKLYEMSKVKPWLLFTCDEEVGGVGASYFCDSYFAGELPDELDELKMLIEIDRKGSNDAVYYDCRNSKFEDYITSKGFVTNYGSFIDISVIAPELNVATVNWSSGYHNPHTLYEYINRRQLENVIGRVATMIDDAMRNDFPKYEYVSSMNLRN